MHRLDHHNGIVHHDGDGKHKGCQREKVEREAEHIEEEERTNQRHRHGNQRDKRGACVLQEDVNHNEHEQEGLKKGLHKVLD